MEQYVEEKSPVTKTRELYKVPCCNKDHAQECIYWPRYDDGEVGLKNTQGESMLELTKDETHALQIVCLRTDVKAQSDGVTHSANKVGLSWACFKPGVVMEASPPTARAAADPSKSALPIKTGIAVL